MPESIVCKLSSMAFRGYQGNTTLNLVHILKNCIFGIDEDTDKCYTSN